MPFLELALRCSASQQPRFESALEGLGALAVTLTDAADAIDEKPILEPGVGETPVWPDLVLTALFAGDADSDLLLHALTDECADVDPALVQFRRVEDQDWERAWMDDYPPLHFGASLWIVPWNVETPADALAIGDDAHIVRLDPGLAFGSGTHATTALCLEWLESLDLTGKSVLDFGCGSGILAIAALKLGAARAVGIDNDPQALLASRDNAERNGIGKGVRVKFRADAAGTESTDPVGEIHSDPFSVFMPGDAPDAQYDVVVANILASALDALAERIVASVAPGGVLALSGILEGQQHELIARYGEWFDDLKVAQREDWLRISGVKKEPG